MLLLAGISVYTALYSDAQHLSLPFLLQFYRVDTHNKLTRNNSSSRVNSILKRSHKTVCCQKCDLCGLTCLSYSRMSGHVYKDSIVYVITALYSDAHDVGHKTMINSFEAKLQHIHLHALFQGERLSTFRQFCIYLQSNI